jgi:serine/threonine-protein kinase
MMLIGQQVGPFLVDKELGSGAMGTVYRATYTKTGQRMALKMMLPGLGTSDHNMERFEREANILKQLNHPNIVRLFGVGKFQKTRYYAMEYVDGEPLDRVMARRGRMSWEEIVDLGQQLCAALQHAHEKGIVHRDLKPSNLMITSDGTLKLTDFGIAKDLDVTALTATNCTVGTASYMSPEQCKGDVITPKSDLYSLGIVFYELVTGRKPFIAENAMEMFLLHVNGEFERPSRLVLDLPVWFDNLICQLLEKKPEHRPLDAAKVAEALGTIQEKVEALQSAGVDAVSARRADRPAGKRQVDGADKDAARTLMAARGKKVRKKKDVPVLQQKWLQGVMLGVLLIVTIAAIVWVLQPKSPERLYKEAEKLMTSRNPDDWTKGYEGPVAEYKKRYAGRKDPETDQINQWAEQYEVYDCGRLLNIMLTRGEKVKTAGPQNDAEKDVYEAAKAEWTGDLAKAGGLWEKAKTKWVGGSGYAQWGQYAAWRSTLVSAAADRRKKLFKEWENLGIKKEEEPKPEGTERHVFRALRYGWFGDRYHGVERLEAVAAELKEKLGTTDKPDENETENRVCLLVVLNEVFILKTEGWDTYKTVEARQKIVEEKLARATNLPQNERVEKRRILMDIIKLYDNKEDFFELVGKAKQQLTQVR